MATQIKFDERNYRKHSKKNKAIIKKSLSELGAGRSILLDNEDSLIAGNGVYEQAQALGIPVRVIETDGSELIAVKRTDLQTADEKRRKLALADNVASDLSEFDIPALQADWSEKALNDWGLELPEMQLNEQGQPQPQQNEGGLPAELQGLDLNPDELEKIQGSDEVLKKRVIIVFDEAQEPAVAKMLGVEAIDKIVYNFDEL